MTKPAAMMRILENKSYSYGPRTYANAKNGGVTAAFAVDTHTAGERLTAKAAGTARFISAPLEIERQEISPEIHAFNIVCRMKEKKVNTINIAGNGIYTLSRFGWSQERVNQYIYEVLQLVNQEVPITMIYTGGQTGADIAGAVAARVLGIQCDVHMPKSFRQRLATGEDISRIPLDVCKDIDRMARQIRRDVEPRNATRRAIS